jgi:hypothetical protein
MKWYWIIGSDNTVARPLVVDTSVPEIDRSELISARPIASWDPATSMRPSSADRDGTPDDALQNHLGLPIFSERLKRAIEAAEIGGVQFLPVHVNRSDGSQVGVFHIANVLNLTRALDRTRADYSVFPTDYFLERRRGEISGLRRPALRKAVLGGIDIMRLADYPEPLFASQRLRHVFESNGMTGYSFDEVVAE